MKSKGKWKKLLYVAAPVLWCSVLYVGSNNSLGTVLAKSVTAVTQTLTAIETAVRTQTAVWTMTATGTEEDVTVSAETETKVLKNTETVVAAATETETSVVKTITETLGIVDNTDGVVSTIIMTQTLTGTETGVTQATDTDEAVMTETATVAVTEVSTQAETETMQETMTLTQLLTMTETLTAVDDGEENQVINQIVPVRTPTEEKQKEVPKKEEKQEEWQELWKPQTQEEKQRASYVYPGKVITKAEGAKGQEIESPISVEPAMQGSLCIDAMKRDLSKEYSIAYTYNITYGEEKAGEKKIYSIDEPIRITMSIPKELLKEGRSFEMICVSENGATYKIPAEVDENGNLTFTTRYFYAYALTYKDA